MFGVDETMNLFKGYVPTKDKKCRTPFKGKNLQTLKDVYNLPEYAGVLAEDVILIDVDDLEQSDILFKIIEDNEIRCRIYQTSRGKHFLFKNNGVERCRTNARLACGLDCDIKLGSRNSYSILKFDGKEREILYDVFEDEDYQTIPKWLFPVNSKIDFKNLDEGDGRNQTLFNYILTLQSNGFSKDEGRETIRIINKYLLKSPLDDSELETVLRDESFKKPVFFEGKTFLFDKFANYLQSEHYIVKINGQPHIYRDGVYIDGMKPIEQEMIKHIPNLTQARRKEVLAYLDLIIDSKSMSDANLIAFNNGVYDLSNGQFKEFSPDFIILNKIPWNYNPDAKSEIIDKTLSKLACGDTVIIRLLEESIGYTLYRRNELRKCFLLKGEKANGKSTYLEMLKTMLGEDNVSALDLKDFGDRFSPASLFGKLANIGDDIGDDFITGTAAAQFKKVVSGNRIKGENKGEREFFFNPYCKIIFSANNIPRIKDKSGAVLDRLVIIPMDAKFSKNDPDFDPYIIYKLRSAESMEYLIQVGLKGLERVLSNNGFTECEKVKRELQEYEESNNPIIGFFSELDEDELLNDTTKDGYIKYREFCIVNNFTPMSHNEFSKQVKKHFHYDTCDKKINGKRCRIFVRGK